jgi:carboxypeptidase Q
MRTPLASLAVVLLVAGPVAAQPSADELARFDAAFERIFDEALTERRTYSMLEELCQRAPRRLSGTPAAAAAVEWARQTMIAAGLENVRLEPCMVPRWRRGEVELLRLTAPEEAAGEVLPILALGGSSATARGGVTAEVLVVGSVDELRERAAEARGKIVLFNVPMDPTDPNPFSAYGGAVGVRYAGPAAAHELGAVGAVVRSMTPNLDDIPHTGGTTADAAPACAVSTNGAERIADLSARGLTVRAHLELTCEWLDDVQSYNVVGELRGSSIPDEVIVVGGHLDAWDVGQGAHDCGGGCCQSIEALALLKRLDLRPRRTLRAVLFMNEENGLRGARAYRADHDAEMPGHVMALESDRGVFAPRGFTSDANPEAMTTLRAIAGLLDEYGASLVRPGGGGADISPMRDAGVVQVGYLPDPQRYFDYHHTEADVFEAVHWRELEMGTAAIASLIYAVAELEERLPANPLEDEPAGDD